MKGSPVYLRDLEKDKQMVEFLGKSLKGLKLISEATGREIIVGYYLDTPEIE